ncbi:MAG: DNA (cytosine-5-)-methyltransferase [Robiginitomaculum sp.]|nr:MAG: DNA (cytosine-5-)-methyltransferase [Robiginitomaculum sp.]
MLIIDGFAGGGGASTGIELALGRSPDFAVNHDAIALSMHEANHPDTTHLVKNIWHVDPAEIATRGKPVGLAWFSPDCKHHSKAKGGKPLEKGIRDLGWVPVLWAERAKPLVIMLENVEEFQDWGPLTSENKPDPDRKGETFQKMISALRRYGYKVEWKELRACDYGAPTIRKRLFMIARRDGQPIVWPKPSHAKPGSPAVISGKAKPWRSAASIIDWSLPCPSIFDTSAEIKEKHGLRAIRPLADNTLRRVARGIDKFVLQSPSPFIVPITHTKSGDRVEPIGEPLRTTTTAKGGERMVAVPSLIQIGYGERKGEAPRIRDIHDPVTTVVAGGIKAAMVTAFLAQHNTGAIGRAAGDPLATATARATQINIVTAHMSPQFGTSTGRSIEDPNGTVTTRLTDAIVATNLLHLKGTARSARDMNDPLTAVCANGTHAALVAAFMVKYYGAGVGASLDEPCHTTTTRDRFGLVTVIINGQTYAIVDIGMRMLTPRELFRAQGFPDDYIIDRGANGERLTKTQQIRMCGNSVCPPLAEALVRANCQFLMKQRKVA